MFRYKYRDSSFTSVFGTRLLPDNFLAIVQTLCQGHFLSLRKSPCIQYVLQSVQRMRACPLSEGVVLQELRKKDYSQDW